MTVADYLLDNSVESLRGMQVSFESASLRTPIKTGRFEGLDGDGRAIVRYNGVNDFSWNLPCSIDPNEVEVVTRNGNLVPYNARPMTQ